MFVYAYVLYFAHGINVYTTYMQYTLGLYWFLMRWVYWLVKLMERQQVAGRLNLQMSSERDLGLVLTRKMKWIVL